MQEIAIRRVSLPQSVANALVQRLDGEGYAIAGSVDQEALDRAEKSVLAWMSERSSEREILDDLGALKFLTNSRQMAQQDIQAQIHIYARKLSDWPAEAVRRVLRSQPSISKWWPTWQELEERLKLECEKPKAALSAIEDARRGKVYRRGLTQEERERIERRIEERREAHFQEMKARYDDSAGVQNNAESPPT